MSSRPWVDRRGSPAIRLAAGVLGIVGVDQATEELGATERHHTARELNSWACTRQENFTWKHARGSSPKWEI